jgi:prolyl oligopeptidase
MSSIPSLIGGRTKWMAAVPAAAVTSLVAACALLTETGVPAPPETRVALVVDTFHGVAVPDPYRWLDDQNSPETRAWIDAQNAYAEQIIGQTPVRTWLEQRLQPLLDVEDVGTPRRAGDYQYFTLRRRGDEVASIYRRPAPPPEQTGPIDPAGEYEKVIDALAFAADGTTSVEPVTFSSDGKLMVYHVRDGGPDEIEIRIRDLETGADLPDRLSTALYSGISFSGDGRGIYYVRRGRAEGDGSRAYYHVLGTDVATDKLLFGEKYGPSTYVDVSELADGRYLLFAVRHGWARSELHVLDRQAGGGVRPIVDDADARFYHEFIDGLLYVRTNLDADRNRVLAIDLANPARENWREIIPESDDVIEDFTLIDGKWYVTYLHDASNRIRVFEKDGTPAGEVEVPEFHSASIRGGRDGEALLTLTSFTTPSTVYRIDLATGERTVHEPPEVEWDGSNYTVSQVWRTSKDGTRAPMFIVHRRDIQLNGQNPTLLTGYGGFYVARKPSFNTTAALWLELGGVFALATLRGGSEYGEAWHRAGMLENKQNVFDDFISAAEWLIENDYTSPEKLAIQGGSNGGLLVGAALTQRPDLYRAVLIGFPDVDILRFFQHHGSNSPPALLEYGNSAIPSQFEAIRKYSPVQNVREGVAYPAVMFNTGDLDTRVPPLGARKMTAALQAASTSGHPVILSYSPRAGHAGGRPYSQRLKLTAMQFAFLIDQLDMEVPIETTP